MKRFATATVCAVLMVLVTGCMSIHPASPTKFGDHANLPQELARVLRDYERAWAAKDAAALTALFAHDGFVLSNFRPPVRGHVNIAEHYAGAGGPLVLRATAWRTQRDIGWIIGEYDQDASFADPGKFTLTLVRDHNQRWLIYSDMDNGSSPPQRPPQSSPTSAPVESSP